MNVIVNFVFKGRNLMIPKSNLLSIVFNKIFHPNEEYKLPSGIERKMTYGYAEISKEIRDIEVEKKLEKEISLIRENFTQLKSFGLEETILYLTFEYDNQYNWEFSPTLLGQLSDLRIVLSISAYEARSIT